VADECALKLAILKMKVTQHDVGSFGKRKVAGRCFASSSSERGGQATVVRGAMALGAVAVALPAGGRRQRPSV
jgi:hypothetical protein